MHTVVETEWARLNEVSACNSQLNCMAQQPAKLRTPRSRENVVNMTGHHVTADDPANNTGFEHMQLFSLLLADV
jgi:hypothetical protein